MRDAVELALCQRVGEREDPVGEVTKCVAKGIGPGRGRVLSHEAEEPVCLKSLSVKLGMQDAEAP